MLDKADATGKLRIVQQMSINIIPIIEKGLLDPVITHGCDYHQLWGVDHIHSRQWLLFSIVTPTHSGSR